MKKTTLLMETLVIKKTRFPIGSFRIYVSRRFYEKLYQESDGMLGKHGRNGYFFGDCPLTVVSDPEHPDFIVALI